MFTGCPLSNMLLWLLYLEVPKEVNAGIALPNIHGEVRETSLAYEDTSHPTLQLNSL
jgi:hypothetical protein